MNQFTDDQIHSLMEQAKVMLEGIGEGLSVRDIMARHYVDSLDDKTLEQGLVMADAMLEAVKDFDTDYHRAVEDMDGFIRRFQEEADRGKTRAERCNYWLRLAGALNAAGQVLSDSEADRYQILSQLEGLKVSEEEATPQLEEELRRRARDAMKESGILLTGIVANADVIEQVEGPEETAELLIDLGNQETEYRAMVAMLAYTHVKTGQMENIPVDMTAVQLTHLVCSQVEYIRILNAVGKDYSMEVAEMLLYALGLVVLVKVFTPLLFVTINLTTEMFGALLLIPAMMMTSGLYLYAFDKAQESWRAECGRIIRVSTVAVSHISRAARKLVNYVKVSVFPGISRAAKSIFKALIRLATCSGTKEQTVQEEAVEDDDEIFVDMDELDALLTMDEAGQGEVRKAIALT